MFHQQLSEKAFRRVVEPHLGRLFRIAWHLTGTSERAEDLVQELLTRLWERPGRLAEADRPEIWLGRALHHLHVDRVRRERRRPEGGAVELDEGALADKGRVGAPSEQAWMAQHVLRLVMELPAPQRMVVLLHDVEGYSLAECADILHIRGGTVKSRLGRAHGVLRAKLAGNPSGGTDVYVGEAQSNAVQTI